MSFDRRTMLKGAAGLTAAGLSASVSAKGMRPRVGVVGGGIIGCSIAFHLARSGADVTLFEKNSLASGATRNSLAWINPVVLDEHYMKLRLLSMTHWRELDRRLGIGVVWGGSVSWTKGDAKGKALLAKADLLRKIGGDPEMLADAAAVSAKSPAVTTGGDISAGMYLAADGHVDPVAAARRFAAAAVRSGAKIIESCEVQEIERTAGAITGVGTTKGRFPVDQLIFVGGTDTPHLLSLIDYPFKLAHSPGLVVHTTAQPIATRMAYEASGELEFKQYANGQFVTSFTSGPPNLPQHAEILAHQMDYPSDQLRQWHGSMLIKRTADFMPAIAKATPQEILLGFRPMPLDKLPVVGPVPGRPGVYVVVTHSGVTLAPVLGDHVTREVLGGSPLDILAPYRPGRFVPAAA